MDQERDDDAFDVPSDDRRSSVDTGHSAGDGAALNEHVRIAREQPRNMRIVRRDLKRLCTRVTFARKAMYRKPVEDRIVEGFSIAFVEQALGVFGNVYQRRSVSSETSRIRIVRVDVVELERFTTFSAEEEVEKTCERYSLREGERAIKTATNARGETVWIVPAGREELRTRETRAVSLALRQAGVRLLPRDLLETCEKQIKATLEAYATKHRGSEIASLLDGFGKLGVCEAELQAYLDHPLSIATSAELVELRALQATIAEQPALWRVILSNSPHRPRPRPQPEPEPNAPAQGVIQAIDEASARRARRTEGRSGLNGSPTDA